MGDFFTTAFLLNNCSSFSYDCSFSFTIQLNNNEEKKCTIHAQTHAHAHWISWLCWFYFQFLKCYCFGSTRFIFVLFFSLFLVLLLLLVCSFWFAMLSVRWSTVIALWLRISCAQWTHNHHIVHRVAPGCNLTCSLSLFQSFWHLLYHSKQTVDRLCIQSFQFSSIHFKQQKIPFE